jgi:acyl carrier protein
LIVTDVDTRLTNCFLTAFPELRPEKVELASTEDTPSWDSMGALTLAALIEEEFGVRFADHVLPSLKSYQLIRAQLAKSMPANAPEVLP